MNIHYDAILIVSFGRPEGRDDVVPFLENVLRGKNVPRERMLAVAKHYDHFVGVSPFNRQTRELIAALDERWPHDGPHPAASGEVSARSVHALTYEPKTAVAPADR